MTWNHFAAVGGVVKGKVWIATKSRKTLVNSAKDFADCATIECTKINILYTPKEDVEANKSLLDARFSRALEITGIQSYHMFWRADESHIYACLTAVSKEIKIKVIRESLVRRRFRFSEVCTAVIHQMRNRQQHYIDLPFMKRKLSQKIQKKEIGLS